MTRNLKVLGVAVVAALALSAVVSAAAQAALTVTPAEYPAILTPDSIGTQKFTINKNQANASTLECTTIKGESTIKEKGAGDTEVTVSNLAYEKCTSHIGATEAPTTVDMEGCDYLFHGGAKSATKEDYFENAQVNLVCPASVTGPKITIFSDAAHTMKICEYTVWKANNLGNITYTNTTTPPDDFDIDAIEVPLETTKNKGVLCPTPVEASRYNGETTITAFKDEGGKEGARIGVTVS